MLVTVRPTTNHRLAFLSDREPMMSQSHHLQSLKRISAAFSRSSPRRRVQDVIRVARSVTMVKVDASKRDIVFIINPQGEWSTGEGTRVPARGKMLRHCLLEAIKTPHRHSITAYS